MNLVKWLRKNNKKIMAVVVIGVMFGFIGGSYLRRLGQRAAMETTVAYFADNQKITNYDLAYARQELEILRMLRADDLLRSLGLPLFGTADLYATLLAELLFAEQRVSPELINRIKQLIRRNDYRLSDKQINDIYRRTMGSDIYWLLLRKETELAGIKISNERAGNLLGIAIPQLFSGAEYSQVIGSIVNPPAATNRQGIPENEILETFGKLLAVLQYARAICSSENITAAQIRHGVSQESETLSAEFVKFDSAMFAEDLNEPAQGELVEHFDKYKKFFISQISEENPYGFGYKLPDRVQLEYIAVKLEDVSEIVTEPTQEETEEYYQKNTGQFTYSVPSDPNDPNSPQIEKSRSYAEVAGAISNQLLRNKKNSKAEQILKEADGLTGANLAGKDLANLTAEQLKQMSGDYKTAAEQLSEKYKINVYTGKTGLLSAADIQADRYFGRLQLISYLNNPLRLTQIVFAIDDVGTSELGPFDIPKPRIHQNIGPMSDIFGQIKAVVRIINAEKATEPESINHIINKQTITFPEPEESIDENIYAVKDKVIEDLNELAAMDVAKSKAEEFIELATTDSWEAAIDKFNDLYGQQSSPGDPNSFRLQKQTNLQRISHTKLETIVVQMEGNPAAELIINESKKASQLINQLYSLVPEGKDNAENLPVIMEFKPDMTYFCLKDVSIKRFEQEEFEKIKGLQAYKENVFQSQPLAAVHFDPENIIKRLRFRPVEQKKEPADANEAAQAGSAS
jgi:hypothetical protein